jgi:hypothetical protein
VVRLTLYTLVKTADGNCGPFAAAMVESVSIRVICGKQFAGLAHRNALVGKQLSTDYTDLNGFAPRGRE